MLKMNNHQEQEYKNKSLKSCKNVPKFRCMILNFEMYPKTVMLGEPVFFFCSSQMAEILVSSEVQNISNSHKVAIWFY